MPAPAPSSPASVPVYSMSILSWSARTSGSLRGFVDVKMPSGMVLHRCCVFRKENGHAWVAPPGRPMLARDGTVEKTSDGKTRYEPTVSFVDRATSDRWSDAVIAALKYVEPAALA